MNNQLLPGFDPTAEEQVYQTNLAGRIERAVKLLRDNVPPEGYYLAFSGGKDSCVIKKLADLSGVKYDAHYSKPPLTRRSLSDSSNSITRTFNGRFLPSI